MREGKRRNKEKKRMKNGMSEDLMVLDYYFYSGLFRDQAIILRTTQIAQVR